MLVHLYLCLRARWTYARMYFTHLLLCSRAQGLGTESQFTVIEFGKSKTLMRANALGHVKGADRLSRVSGLDKV